MKTNLDIILLLVKLIWNQEIQEEFSGVNIMLGMLHKVFWNSENSKNFPAAKVLADILLKKVTTLFWNVSFGSTHLESIPFLLKFINSSMFFTNSSNEAFEDDNKNPAAAEEVADAEESIYL